MADKTTLDAYEACIGIETHVQLNTQTKIFCSCPNKVVKTPNVNICPICTGYPGVLPVVNKDIVQAAILMGLATSSRIDLNSIFARKHYFYPDLPKNFQITQADRPICSEGIVTITDEAGNTKNIRLVRIHMEEDAGKNMHSPTTNESFVDLNRTGTPLLEIVSYPDISSATEARAYLKELRNIVLHLAIGTGNMEDGALRADTNISVRKKGEKKLGTKVELKNINSFKFVADAIEYEIKRQVTALEQGQPIQQETRSWDQHGKQTIVMRSKEEAADYRYFHEPDLPTVHITQDFIEQAQKKLPELPQQRLARYLKQDLSFYEATILIDDLALALYFDKAYTQAQSKTLINWVLRDVIGYLNEQKITLEQFKITPEHLAELIQLIDNKTINTSVAQEIFEQAAQTGSSPKKLVQEQGLTQINNQQELETIVAQVIAQYPNQVTAYKNGNQKLFGFFVGQAMKETKGRANPQLINEILNKLLR
jgi:aspartyl-tRNA(Asn)/glutamyl-tRNA(Gln) amidotransferase subunit B